MSGAPAPPGVQGGRVNMARMTSSSSASGPEIRMPSARCTASTAERCSRSRWSIVHDPELAADVVQQTFVKAWRAASSFDDRRELAPWLYSIARHTAIDALRSEKRPTRGGHQPEVEVEVEGESMERTWERFEVRRGDRCPSARRARSGPAVTSARGDPRSDRHQLGIPVGTVKSRSGRAHKRLAVALAHLDTGEIAANQAPPPNVLIDEEPR